MLPNSRILIHQPSAGFEGQSTEIEIHAREILKVRERIDEIYAQHTGLSQEQVRQDMERDRFFTAEQAVEYGLVDRVLGEHTEVASEPGRSRLVSGASLPLRASSDRVLDRAEVLDLDAHDVVADEERGGFCPTPTPEGVPVRIKSPVSSVQVSEMNSISSGIEKIRLEVLESWRSSPFTHVRSVSWCGSAISSAVVIQGPYGQKPSAPLARVHCGSRPCRSRAVTSSATA